MLLVCSALPATCIEIFKLALAGGLLGLSLMQVFGNRKAKGFVQ